MFSLCQFVDIKSAMCVWQFISGELETKKDILIHLCNWIQAAGYTAAGLRPQADIHTIGCHQMELHSCKGTEVCKYLYLIITTCL